jgi:radical SAM superfamily enzyme YgiQ (UPF0313 family)
MILLVHPPAAKPSEPPAGVARLAGFLSEQRVPVRVLDANLEGFLSLLEREPEYPPADRFGRRAALRRAENLALLASLEGYRNRDRYARAVNELTGALSLAVGSERFRLTFADFTDAVLSPLRSVDLLAAAERSDENPFFGYFSRRFRELFEDSQPLLVGFSVGFMSQALTAFAMAGFIRESLGFRGSIVMGGGLVTSWLSRPGFSNPFAGLVDELAAGPGEEYLLRKAAGLGVPVKGFGSGPCPRDSSVTETCAKPARESPCGAAPVFPRFGTPEYRFLPIHRYLSPVPVLPYSASSGCPWARCRFCPERAEKNPYRPVPPGRAAEEVASLAARTGAGLVHLLDNEIGVPLLSALALNPPGIPWYGFARCSGRLTDPDFCRSLADAGCVMLKLGVESGSGSVLERLEKGISLDDVSLILSNLTHAGIAAYVYLLFGTPQETEREARETLEFTVLHAGEIRYLNIAVFNLPAASPEAETLETNAFYEGDLSLYREFRHPAGWNRDKVRRFLDREFRSHPAVRPIVRRTPPVFTSNHAPFFEPFRGGTAKR